ncbi:hypothetical protein NDU88_005516 [Pleurodeles waltl]|uniref:Uncharacterized protein n=1 Tax=Pleurodeles waltl TaxID=8319 RepID=A0AAV7LLF4_PLEWA|nr:hypothetical protein NDU88_005516 [Pleurodeles waltl]
MAGEQVASWPAAGLPTPENICDTAADRCLQGLCDGLLQMATDPPDVAAQIEPAAPDPEGEGPSTNPLRLPGAEGQRQQLRALSGVKPGTATEKGSEVEESQTEKPENAAKKTTTSSTPKQIRGAISTKGRAGQSQGETQNSTSSAGGAQREFESRFRRSVAFPALEEEDKKRRT